MATLSKTEFALALHNRIKEVSEEYGTARLKLADATTKLIDSQYALSGLEARLKEKKAAIMGRAYEEGVITGKNQAERDLQMDLYVQNDHAYIQMKDELGQWESQVRTAQIEIESWKAETDRFRFEKECLLAQVTLWASLWGE